VDIRQGRCTSCNASIEIDSTQLSGICSFCGNAYVVQKALQNIVVNNNSVTNIYNNFQQNTVGQEYEEYRSANTFGLICLFVLFPITAISVIIPPLAVGLALIMLGLAILGIVLGVKKQLSLFSPVVSTVLSVVLLSVALAILINIDVILI